LITLYRGGILPFLAFMAVVVISIVLSYRAMRSDSLPLAMYGGLFFGINVVQFNLDHNVADLPQSVVLWSMFLAFLLYVDDVRKERTLERASDIESPPKFEVLTRPR
jgi:hypothetical protein